MSFRRVDNCVLIDAIGVPRGSPQRPKLRPQAVLLSAVLQVEAPADLGGRRVDDGEAQAAADRAPVSAPEEALANERQLVLGNAGTFILHHDATSVR